MRKTIALIALGAALGLAPAAALAVSGNSSSYGSVGLGPHVPTQALTPFQRSWNHANECKYQARRAGAEWLRAHGKARFRSDGLTLRSATPFAAAAILRRGV